MSIIKSAFADIPERFAVVPFGDVTITALVSPPMAPALFVTTESSFRLRIASAFAITLGEASIEVLVPYVVVTA